MVPKKKFGTCRVVGGQGTLISGHFIERLRATLLFSSVIPLVRHRGMSRVFLYGQGALIPAVPFCSPITLLKGKFELIISGTEGWMGKEEYLRSCLGYGYAFVRSCSRPILTIWHGTFDICTTEQFHLFHCYAIVAWKELL
jgi:hypothetical protein